MRRFWGFVIKEFYHIVRDKRSMLIMFGMPAIQVLLFGFVITNEIKDAKIAILDESKDEVTKSLTQKILSSGYFLLENNITNRHQIEESFKQGDIKLIIIFGRQFGKNLEKTGIADIQILTDATDPNTANILSNYASAVLNDYLRGKINNIQNPMTPPLKQGEFAGINPQVRMFYNPELKAVFMFVPGIIASLLMLLSAMMTSISITREKELGTMEVLLVSPLKPAQIIIGKVLPYIILAMVDFTSILLLGKYVFGLPIYGNVLFLFGESLLYIFMALSLGIMISTISETQQIAMMLSMFALMMPTILLSGFIFPIENMPLPLQWFSNIIPARWFIIIIKNIMLKGTGLEFVWKETLIILGYTILFLTISIKRFKTRLE
ncbi:MAG: ABC transporter permease [FCB group bacterium]